MTHLKGSKVKMCHFFQNFQNATPPTDYIHWSCDSRMLISLTHSTKVIPLNWNRSHFGSQALKVDFHQKCYKSSMLHSTTIRVIHVYKLKTFYSCCGSQVNQGSHDVKGVKSLFDVHFYSTLNWAWLVAGWETTLSRARPVAAGRPH